MAKFQQAVTVIPADWANAVDNLVFGVLQQAKSVDDIKAVLGLGSMAYANLKNPTFNEAVLSKPAITGGTARFDAVTTREPVRPEDAATRNYVDNAVSAVKKLIDKATKATGDLAQQNANNVRIAGGIMDAVTLGAQYPCVGVFSSLQVTTMPNMGNHVVNLAYLKEQLTLVTKQIGTLAAQSANAVTITGGTIENTVIGKLTPADAYFNRVKVLRQPLDGADAISKAYFEDVLNKSVNAVKSMALQDASSVAVTGGTVNGTQIGNAVPAGGVFNNLTVVAPNISATEKGMPTITLTVDTTKPVASQLVFSAPPTGAATTPTVSGFLSVMGASNAQYPNGLVLQGTESVAVQNGSGYGLAATANQLTLFSKSAQLITLVGQKIRLGGGSFSDTATVTINTKAYLADTQAKRITGVDSLLHTVDNGVSGGILAATTEINTTAAGGALVKLDKDTAFTFRSNADDSGMLRTFRMVINVMATGLNVSWPTSVEWCGAAPSYTAAAVNTSDLLDFTTMDGGATWYGVKLN